MIKRLILFIAFLSSCCFADQLSLPTVFSDHMVLQRGRAVPVWGKTDPGALVTVDFADQSRTVTAEADGKWRVDLERMPASAVPRTMTVSSGDVQIFFEDVLVGDVWLCSGQSNMELTMNQTENAAAGIAAADCPAIRLFKAPRAASAKPEETIHARWAVCTPETVTNFSGVAYYFGRKLQKDLNVPIGLLGRNPD